MGASESPAATRQIGAAYARTAELPTNTQRTLLREVTSLGEYPMAGMVLPMWRYFLSVRLRVPW